MSPSPGCRAYRGQYGRGMPGRKPTLALVEDAPRDANIIINALATHGVDFDIVWLRSGERAQDYFAHQTHAPHVALIDLELGDQVHGFAVLRTIRDNPAMAEMPVVVVTSWDTKRHRELAEVFGVEVFEKPLKVAGYAPLAERLRGLI